MNLFLSHLLLFPMCFWCFTLFSESKIVYSHVPFDLCVDFFDKVVVLFNSRICVCEFSVWVNCPWQILVPADSVSLFFLFSFTRGYSVCLCVFMGVWVHVCLYTFVFLFYCELIVNYLKGSWVRQDSYVRIGNQFTKCLLDCLHLLMILTLLSYHVIQINIIELTFHF